MHVYLSLTDEKTKAQKMLGMCPSVPQTELSKDLSAGSIFGGDPVSRNESVEI
jgi:hypothetical protein